MDRILKLIKPIYILVFFLLISLNAFAGDYHNYKKPEDVVASIYRDFAFEAIMQDYWKNASLIEQPKKILLLYFTNELASLIIKDRQNQIKTRELGRLDFNLIFDSQDPGAMDLQISPVDKSNIVKVQFRYPGNGEQICLAYKVVSTSQGWRIKDIIYKNSGSLLKLLSNQN